MEVCWTHQVSTQVSGHYQVEPHQEQEEDVDKVQFLVQTQGIVTKEGAYIAIYCDAEDKSYKWDSEKTKPTQIMITHIKSSFGISLQGEQSPDFTRQLQSFGDTCFKLKASTI